MNIPRPFSTDGDDTFDTYDEFVPESLPDPGPFLTDHDVLRGADHLAVHRLARSLFETHGVYDVTFGYNLARLNIDRRHPDAGFRYARQDDAGAVLRAEFTPTTAFCPQSDTLTTGAMRAFNGETGRHEYEVVRVRVAPMHNEATGINRKLEQQEAALRQGESESGDGDDSDGAPF